MAEAKRAGEDDRAIAVTIFGQTYHLRGSEDGTYLSELANVVDLKMREVVAATGTADTVKIAILAALNIVDDNLRASRDHHVPQDDPRLTRMITLLDEALAG